MCARLAASLRLWPHGFPYICNTTDPLASSSASAAEVASDDPPGMTAVRAALRATAHHLDRHKGPFFMQSQLIGRRPRGLAAALLLSTSLIAGAAQAQETPPAGAQATGTDQVADPAEQSQLEEITVYARKRAENVQQVPIPVTVITPQELTRQNLVNFVDFQTKFPSFSVYLTNP